MMNMHGANLEVCGLRIAKRNQLMEQNRGIQATTKRHQQIRVRLQ